MTSRRLLPTLSLGTALALLALLLGGGRGPLGPVVAHAEEEAPAEAVPLEVAMRDLEDLDGLLKKSRSSNPDIIAAINAVAAAYGHLLAPTPPELEPIPDDATEEERKAIEERNAKTEREFEVEKKKFDREAEKFNKDVVKSLLKALKLEKIDPHTKTNLRDDVVIAAARALASTGDPDVALDIQAVIERNIMKAKHEVPSVVLDEVFGACAKLNNHKVLEWMGEEFSHTKASPRSAVDQLNAAHKAMVLFTDVPGKVRYAIVDAFIKSYSGVESLAEQSSTEPNVQSAQEFWGRIKTDAIRVVQYFALEPTDDEGKALARMDEFQRWFRDHDNQRRPPWLDAD